MGEGERVRASRDGDRFHYYWAARRALRLLDSTTTLQVVSVEGLPAGETVDGEEVIDVAEFFGGHTTDTCSTVRFIQLKHSTLRVDEPIVASELRNTLEKFAKIYRSATGSGAAEKLRFAFVANRCLGDKVRLSLQQLADGVENFAHRDEAALLRRYLGFGEAAEHERDFCRRLQIDDGSPGLAELERLVHSELQQFLPGGTGTEMTQLVEAVARCATSLADRQTLERGDVLLALRVTAEALFPAPSSIERLEEVIRTHDVARVAAELDHGPFNKLLVTAVGGVGKSVLTTVLPRVLPDGSVTVVYDCFAGGDYRKITSQRHDHRTALTQIANQLAGGGWCNPLIPTQAADADYVRVFMHRVQTAARQLALAHPGALLAVVVDAADNAATAAAAQRHRTFVTDLFREDWPVNARLVQLCRPERVTLVEVPRAGVTTLALHGFDRSESLQHLRTRFPNATAGEGAELHALSSGNPRVQAMAMETASSVGEALTALQIARNTPGEVLDGLLLKQVHAVIDHGHLRPEELEQLCRALATLHPAIPLDDLAAVSAVDANAIRSFAVALGRGLHLAGNTLQFRDEPTENWFRTTYALDGVGLRQFVDGVRPHAATSPYIASVLPQLLFEADMLDELVELALSDAALPGGTDESQAREITRSRARFALGATLRMGRHTDAARLAVRNGALSSGHTRRMALIRSHTDLAARFLGAELVETLCSGSELATDWPGSNLHVEAALLSHVEQLADLARSRLRSAQNNFAALLRVPDDEHHRLQADITSSEVADLAMAAINTGGPLDAVEFLDHWKPDEFVHEVAAKLAVRLVDAGRDGEVNELVVASADLPHVQMAAAGTMFSYGIVPADEALASLIAVLAAHPGPFPWAAPVVETHLDMRAVVWVLVHGLRGSQISEEDALRLLDLHLPQHLPDHIGDRVYGMAPTSLLLAHALRARLGGRGLSLQDVASAPLLELMDRDHISNHNARSFQANVPGLLPWVTCWLNALLDGDLAEVVAELEALIDAGLKSVGSYDTPYVLVNGIAEIGARVLGLVGHDDLVTRFAAWHKNADPALQRSRLTVSRIAARSPHLELFGLDVVTRGVGIAQQDRTDAETRIESLIGLARTLLAVNEPEARALFDAAVEEADLVGNDLYDRWRAMTTTAAALTTGHEPARGYRLFQIAEMLDHQGELDTVAVGQRLLGMHEPTYLVATSRARDRRTLDLSSLLTAAFRTSGRSQPEQLDLLALAAFRPLARWQSVVTALYPAVHARATSALEKFSRFERAPGEAPERAYTSRHAWTGDETDLEEPADPAGRWAQFDLTTEDGWNQALAKVGWRPEERRALAEHAMAVNPRHRPQVLDALTRTARADEADFEAVARAAAAARPQTPALTRALTELGTVMVTRFARNISTRYEDDHLVAVAEATGTTVAAMSRLAFTELGRSAHLLSYRSCFLLAAQLAIAEGPEAAGQVFDDLSDLFEDLVPSPTSSDGAVEALPIPPDDHAAGVAGLLWAALGDVTIRTRWQAAHAVLLLVRLGCRDELDALRRYADGSAMAAPFHDARFPFYALHARMWLLLAMARGAREPGAAVLSGFTRWLVRIVRGPRHAANQVLAQQVLNTLLTSGYITVDAADIDVLTQPVRAATTTLDYVQRQARPDPLRPETDEDFDRYPFFLDFAPYWCDDVAEAFGSTEDHVARRAVEIASELDSTGLVAARDDPRSRAGVYDSQRTYASHGSWPEQENHAFYLAIHALLTVGAELAGVTAAYQDPESLIDSYTGWLARFLPKRPDGRWLADRRDRPPSPAPEQALARHEPKTTWPWSLRRGDFDAAAGAGGEWVTVGAHIDTAEGNLSEETLVETALVPHETARALLIAAQTSPRGPSTFSLPTTDYDYDRPADYPFALTAWLDHSTRHQGIDVYDERAGGITFPPIRPGHDIVARFSLEPDEDQRLWYQGETVVFRSTVWDDMRSVRSDRETGTRGDRLEVHHEFLQQVLHELDRTLVVQVRLRRDHRHPYYERRKDKDDEFEWLDWSGKVYLIDPAGHWFDF